MTIGATHLGEALGTDFFSVREQFTDEQWDKFVTVRRFVDTEVVPVAGQYWERAEIAWDLVRRLPELGIVGTAVLPADRPACRRGQAHADGCGPGQDAQHAQGQDPRRRCP
ncbi:MAG TPA: acyl-CoA dehydrogenase family protein [Streptosporangiaceae bacterium]|nr:acyl-CoA dehydrogenase family protein [Streptosporangiaceae bacterium]